MRSYPEIGNLQLKTSTIDDWPDRYDGMCCALWIIDVRTYANLPWALDKSNGTIVDSWQTYHSLIPREQETHKRQLRSTKRSINMWQWVCWEWRLSHPLLLLMLLCSSSKAAWFHFMYQLLLSLSATITIVNRLHFLWASFCFALFYYMERT